MSRWPQLTFEERFWAKVERRGLDECWPWRGARDGGGYGHINDGGKITKAHRVAWRIANKRDPGVGCVCHSCDNPVCVNPGHLWLGSHADNMRDMGAKGRTTFGEKQPNRKLSKPQVEEILRLMGSTTQTEIARRFGVHPSTISLIHGGRLWSKAVGHG